MAEYIKREDVLMLKKEIGAYGMDISSKDVEKLPAADVVKIVRCKDCKWWGVRSSEDERKRAKSYDYDLLCEMHYSGFCADDYCSFGKKRGEK